MTLPDERYRAIKYAREFLRELLDPKKTPKVPTSIRRQAYSVLRHFPTEHDMNLSQCTTPDVWGEYAPDIIEYIEFLKKT